MQTIFKPLALFVVLVGLFLGVVSYITPVKAQDLGSWDRSSLHFSGECTGICGLLQATVCNGEDSQIMTGSTPYEVWYSENGNPKEGTLVASGTINPLSPGACTTLSYTQTQAGNYMFKVYQRPDHPGEGVLWSTTCGNTCASPSPSPDPEVSPSPDPSVNPDPSPSVSPSPDPSVNPSPSPSSSPDPSPGVGGPEPRNGTSLSNDNLQCDETQFDAVFDVFDHGNPVSDLKVTFTFNGSTKEVKTNSDGRAKVQFPIEEGTVTAKADGYSTQSMEIKRPVGCPDVHLDPNRQEGQVLGASTGGRGQVLGASTMADTGNFSFYLATALISLGVVITSLAGYGVYQEV